MIHFDANFLIAAMAVSSPEAQRSVAWIAAENIPAISVMAWAEFLCGPLAANDEERAREWLREIVPLRPADAALAARMFNATGRRSRSLADCLIAAAAIHDRAALATINTDDFACFAPLGLTLA